MKIKYLKLNNLNKQWGRNNKNRCIRVNIVNKYYHIIYVLCLV